ncbi:hypothetical protein HFX_5013 (plasmid) [Haloferax mediterranei ATCC 33500]|uniref:Uncharacterized protein n=1 Tax=Haloferax mediterranei (strain ATCC 33500 / DSM 1411 / JCM 8866 / NBRC 14739 / NCIMB 2177 / R-4) TaxID=523841 RepID=I3R9E0_HALMT|nr:hypothetical protein HFX_5013 [Haloferax mediterranei ATCC 33500]
MARADFLQRVRSSRLVALLAFVIYLGYLVNTGTIDLVFQQSVAGGGLGNYRGVNNAAWIGAKAGLTGSFFVVFFGFYLVKNGLARDRSTEVSELLASMPISNSRYLLGKWLSNGAYLGLIVSVLGLSTVVIHTVHGVGPTNPIKLLLPVVLLAVPTAFLIGGVALLVETVGLLNNTAGNVLYFFGTLALTMLFYGNGTVANGVVSGITGYFDPFGYTAVYVAMYDSVLSIAPNYTGGVPSFGAVFVEKTTFTWSGDGWPLWVYLQRAGMIVVGVGIAVFGNLTFNRFGPSKTESERTTSLLRRLLPERSSTESATEPPAPTEVTLTPVKTRTGGGLFRILLGEFRMTLSKLPWWWYLGAVGIIAASLIRSQSSGPLLLIALIWPIFVLSSMGVRAQRHRMQPLIFSSNSAYTQLLAEWVVGATLIAVLVGSSIGLTPLLTSTPVLLGYVAAILFVPSLALSAGIWSGKSELFEVLYLVIWFVGPANGIKPLVFTATTATALSTVIVIVYICLGLCLFVASFVHRSRQMV